MNNNQVEDTSNDITEQDNLKAFSSEANEQSATDEKHSKESCKAFRSEDIQQFKQNLGDLVEKIKKATHEEMPELKKSLIKLLGTDETHPLFSDKPVINTLKSIERAAEEEVRHLREVGDSYVSCSPWKSLAIVGLLGLFVGTILGRDNHR